MADPPNSSIRRSRVVRDRIRICFKCFCIGGNAVTALGAFTFPIISPDLSENLQLSQSQLSTIVLAGIIGQYPFAALAGELVDRVGTWACSACAAVLFALGYGVFAWMMGTHVCPDDPLSPTAFRIMVVSYFMLGLGAAFSYFSAVFTAAKEFPLHNGLALGTTLALIGLSPLFLSLPSYLFVSPVTGTVDAKAYIIFIGSMAVVMHTISTFGLRGQPPPVPLIEPQPTVEDLDTEAATEATPLIPKARDAAHSEHPQTWMSLIRDGYFWWLFLIMGVTIGSAEMVIGNVGSIVTSLLTVSQGSSQAVSNQVQLLSVCNTVSRLLSGPVIDLLCPNPLYPGRRKHTVSRFAIMALASSILVATYAYMGFFVVTNDYTWLLSGGVGIAYGIFWTVIPGVVKLVWGEAHFGRTFGMISYAPFFGTTLWTYLFAFNVERQSENQKCVGAKCWRTTFQVGSAVVLVAALSLSGLWRRWQATV